MKPTILFLSALLVCAIASGCSSTESSTAPTVKLSADDHEAMMQMWMELATPGEHHAALEPFAGTFAVDERMRHGPDEPWMSASGTATTRWVLGDRFLQTEYRTMGEMGPYEGIGYFGYDNAKQEYVSIWMNTWGTMIAPAATGTMNGHEVTMTQEWEDTLEGRTKTMRMVHTIVDRNVINMKMWSPGPDGSDYLMLDITYTRQ